ncbi:MAG: glycosyltransferase [Aequorivita sp.]|nr:glycosyltransferase [Aequorivita sp.]
MKKLLIIGHTFPEPSTTAAGSRMMQLIGLFREENYQITFASTAAVSERTANLRAQNISAKNIKLNDASFDAFIKELNPEVVLFDRYITEEQFGWRVAENCPNALRVLDTEDLHFLRKAREEAVKNGKPVSEADLFSETAKRELASILRCDVSLIISEYEMELLQNTFKITPDVLFYLPFLVEEVCQNTPAFKVRQNFLAIGNLLHAPNVDSVLQLKKLWPAIKKQLPQAELHIYGAYAPQQILQLHNVNEGFIVKGWAPDVEGVMKNYRVQLAPLHFGAGLKGKLLDAMRFGLPSITTAIGAEGMHGEHSFGGIIASSNEDFISAAVKLYSEENLWNQAKQNGFEIIDKRFQTSLHSSAFQKQIHGLIINLAKHRQHNFIGQLLQHHSMQSTKYLSRWIEAKNSSKP